MYTIPISKGLEQLLYRLTNSLDADLEERVIDKFIGDWDFVQPGQRVIITWQDPYKVDHGFLFTLPGGVGHFFDHAIVQIPTEDNFYWFTLKDLACLATTIELEPLL